jgi:DNA-binding PadR family transcriptional regulator
MKRDSETGSLSPVAYHTLIALGDGPKHGYAIMQEVTERTDGQVHILPGTLYSNIKRMLAERLIEECRPPADEKSQDERRRYYRLTPGGREAAVRETRRMAMLVRLARRRGLASHR